MTAHTMPTPASDWVTRWASLASPSARCLDLAAGSGRHARWLAARGLAVTAVDRDAQALTNLKSDCPGINTLVADLESGPWPLDKCRFDLVIVTNYLWRPRFSEILATLAPGGLLIYETFATGQAQIGRPSRADFLLEPGELLTLCAPLRVHGYEEGLLPDPRRCVQRIAASHTTNNQTVPSLDIYLPLRAD